MVSNSGTMFIASAVAAQQARLPSAGRATSSRSRHRLALGDDVVRQRARRRSGDARRPPTSRIASSVARALGVVEVRRTQRPRRARARARAAPTRARFVERAGSRATTPARASSSATTASCTSAFWRRSSDGEMKAEHFDRALQRRQPPLARAARRRALRATRAMIVEIGDELGAASRTAAARPCGARAGAQPVSASRSPRAAHRCRPAPGDTARPRDADCRRARRRRARSSSGVGVTSRADSDSSAPSAMHLVEVVVERDAPPARGSRSRACRRSRTDCRRGRRRSTSPCAGTRGSAATPAPNVARERVLERRRTAAATRAGTCSGSRRGRSRSRRAPCSLDRRSIAVCHSVSTCALQSVSQSARLVRRERGAVAPACSRRAISRSQSRMLLRCTSVGCAVSTGLTSASREPRAPSRRARRRASRSRSSACARLPGCGGDARERVRAPAPILVHVLGDVGELREIAERAHDVQRLRDRQLVEQRGELGAHRGGVGGVGAAKADGRLANRLDAREAVVARLPRAPRRRASGRAAACLRAAEDRGRRNRRHAGCLRKATSQFRRAAPRD